MTDDSARKQRRVGRIAFEALWGIGLILQVAALIVETPERKTLGRGLRIASLVFWVVALIFQVRYRNKVRTWRQTGKWE